MCHELFWSSKNKIRATVPRVLTKKSDQSYVLLEPILWINEYLFELAKYRGWKVGEYERNRCELIERCKLSQNVLRLIGCQSRQKLSTLKAIKTIAFLRCSYPPPCNLSHTKSNACAAAWQLNVLVPAYLSRDEYNIINVSFCNYCMLLSSFWCLCLIWCQPSLSWPSVRFDLYIDEDKAKHIDTDKGKYKDKGVDIEKVMDKFINLNFDWLSKCWPKRYGTWKEKSRAIVT